MLRDGLTSTENRVYANEQGPPAEQDSQAPFKELTKFIIPSSHSYEQGISFHFK